MAYRLNITVTWEEIHCRTMSWVTVVLVYTHSYVIFLLNKSSSLDICPQASPPLRAHPRGTGRYSLGAWLWQMVSLLRLHIFVQLRRGNPKLFSIKEPIVVFFCFEKIGQYTLC